MVGRFSLFLNGSRNKGNTTSVAPAKTDWWRRIGCAQSRDCWNKTVNVFFLHFHWGRGILCLAQWLFSLDFLPLLFWCLSLLEELEWRWEFMLVDQMLLPTLVVFQFHITAFNKAFILQHRWAKNITHRILKYLTTMMQHQSLSKTQKDKVKTNE